MKIYKFRPLTNESEYCRLKQIIETGYFWCSNFWELNDPMEGVFRICIDDKDKIDDIFSEKQEYKICSFSGEKGLENPLLWGYYASGFKGVAIEIDDVKLDDIKFNNIKVNYDNNLPSDKDDVKQILLSKGNNWEHEDEYRFLIKSPNNNFHRIGTITAVYFGNPYGGLENSNAIQKNEALQEYKKFKEKLKKVIENKDGINWRDVEIIKEKEKIKKEREKEAEEKLIVQKL